jgi:hypothetical protein
MISRKNGCCAVRLHTAVLLSANLCLVVLAGCKTLQMASDWAAKPVVADGESTDWVLASGSAINEGGMQVNASNDSANLHLMVRFRANDEEWPRPCAMTGLTVWLNPSGKKSEDFGIRFAAGPSSESLPQPAGMSGRPGGPQRQALDGKLTFMDQKADTTGSLPADGSRGPSAGFTSESGICTYELSLPLCVADSGRFGIGAKPGGVVMVGLTAGPSKEEREAMGSQRSGMPEGGMGGRPPGGGMGGGPPGGGMGGGPSGGGQRPAMAENPELWFKVKLAPAAAAGTQTGETE